MTVAMTPDNTCTTPTNSALGTFPVGQKPLGLWVHVEVQHSCNPPGFGFGALSGSFTISLTRTAPTPGPTRSIPGQLSSGQAAPGVPAPASVVIPVGKLAPGTYNVTASFPAQTICSQDCPGFGPHAVGASSATGTLVIGCAEDETGNHPGSHVCEAGSGGNHQD
jgi:hypothetical protein